MFYFCVNRLSEIYPVDIFVLKVAIRMDRIADRFDLETGEPAAVFGLEHRVSEPISGLITGSREEIMAELCKSTC